MCRVEESSEGRILSLHLCYALSIKRYLLFSEKIYKKGHWDQHILSELLTVFVLSYNAEGDLCLLLYK